MLAMTQLVGFGVGEPASYVGADAVDGAASTVTWPAGTVAGDAAIIWVVGQAAPSWTGLSGWTTDVTDGPTSSLYVRVYSKILAASDIASAPSFTSVTNGGYFVATYRGASAITFKSSKLHETGTTATITGFTKASGSRLLVTICEDRSDVNADQVAPTSWTERYEEHITYFDFSVADIEPTLYVDSASIQWTGLNSGGSGLENNAAVWELT